MKSRMLLTIVALVVLASLVVVPAASAAPVAGNYGGYDHGKMCAYRVEYGDTLSKIAWRYHTSVWYLRELNHLPNPNCIYENQLLFVPCGCEKGGCGGYDKGGCNDCGYKPIIYPKPCYGGGCYGEKPPYPPKPPYPAPYKK